MAEKMTSEQDNAFIMPEMPSVALDAAGLVALADLTTVQEYTALAGTSSFLDIFLLVPGLHQQQKAVSLNAGEYPACGALTSGYVFRVENPATVFYLQRVGRTGHLTTLTVTKIPESTRWYGKFISNLYPPHYTRMLPGLAYSVSVLCGIAVLILLILSEDWWGVVMIGIMITARLINFIVIRRRSELLWSGAKEPGVSGDLLILLSQDRWIRMKGLVDDLKAVTSGQWFRDKTHWESWFTGGATVGVYLAAALASNIEDFGMVLLLGLLIVSAGLLAFANSGTDQLHMHGCLVRKTGESKPYDRRLTLAKELIKETGRDDWAIRMGMINPDPDTKRVVEVTM